MTTQADTTKNGKPRQVAKHVDGGREVWALWLPDAEAFELFADEECESYIGCADTWAEARGVAGWYFNDMQCR